MRRYRLAHPQRGSQVDVDHQAQRLGGGAERVAWPERTDGVHQHAGGPNLASDPVDERRRHGGVGGVGDLAADIVRQVTQPMLVPVDRRHREAAGGEGHCRRLTKRTAGTGHDRHVSTHGTSAEISGTAP
jgi:hypothetical protein